MDVVKEKMEKLAEHIRVDGYPKRHGAENISYRLDDEYFTYDLFDDYDSNVSVLIVGIERSDETKIPIWKALYRDKKFDRFMPRIIRFGRKK